ncbi:MAG: amino acid racemase [Proteobacteria bacterium]|nr:amino acid racemase [Pseudomonadota bacterium]MBU1716017.1 amino acid racemase [Pseudomonadota bacterium]
MKTIGIIGGIGPESTADYYREIIAAFNTRYQAEAYPEIIIYSANLNELMAIIKNEDWPSLTGWLLKKISAIQRAGADFAAIASNTPHIVFDQLQASSPIPLISIVEQTRNRARELGLKKLGLLGTKLTMTADFYKKPFIDHKMAIFVPTEKEQELIHHRLFSEIELGIFKESTRNELLQIAGRMVNDHQIDGLILGCTELPLILTREEFGIPFLNTAAIHCQSIIEFARQTV